MKKVQCDYNMSFAECELAILRSAVDSAQEKIGRRVIASPQIKKIIEIVEFFLKKKSLICYGGTAINNILPESSQFYNKDVEIPDYDFFSPNAMDDAIELADLYYSKGYKEVESKAGQHHGTFKVYVDFISIADITSIPKELFKSIKMDSISIGGILYCPPNYLRMSMYLELSRPAGDTSRWEKVMKRLSLLNEHYPLTSKQCSQVDFQREMEKTNQEEEIYEVVKQTFRNQGCVFFGGYAISMYAKYMPDNLRNTLERIPDFDVLSNDPEVVTEIVKRQLNEIGIKNVTIIKRDPVGEVIPEHYEIRVGKDTIAFVYNPIGCHSYNIIGTGHYQTKIATIDTMLSFYLAFLYANRPYYDTDRIICMSKYLFDVQQKNRLKQKGLLRRFSITCYGHQSSIEEIRGDKAKMFRKLQHKKGTQQYNEWFLSYKPDMEKFKKYGTTEEIKIHNLKEPKKKTVKNKKGKPKKLETLTEDDTMDTPKEPKKKTIKNKKVKPRKLDTLAEDASKNKTPEITEYTFW